VTTALYACQLSDCPRPQGQVLVEWRFVSKKFLPTPTVHATVVLCGVSRTPAEGQMVCILTGCSSLFCSFYGQSGAEIGLTTDRWDSLGLTAVTLGVPLADRAYALGTIRI
jgi:hypothetical protein